MFEWCLFITSFKLFSCLKDLLEKILDELMNEYVYKCVITSRKVGSKYITCDPYAFFVSPFLLLRRPCQAGLPNVVEVCVTHTSLDSMLVELRLHNGMRQVNQTRSSSDISGTNHHVYVDFSLARSHYGKRMCEGNQYFRKIYKTGRSWFVIGMLFMGHSCESKDANIKVNDYRK